MIADAPVAALETRGLHKSFGALTVANAIDFRLEHGARHALIGPNGAGKTSFVNLITGALRASAGTIHLNGADITGLPQPARVKRGLARTFQINALFRRLCVLENVTLAIAEREGVAGQKLRPAGRYRAVIDEAYELLETLGLADDAKRRALESAADLDDVADDQFDRAPSRHVQGTAVERAGPFDEAHAARQPGTRAHDPVAAARAARSPPGAGQ